MDGRTWSKLKMNAERMSEVIDHVRTSFAFNLENVKVVIHVVLLIWSKLLSHPIFIVFVHSSGNVHVHTPDFWPKMGLSFGLTYIWPFYFLKKYFVVRLMSLITMSVPYSTTSGQTLVVQIRHKTGNVNNDRHFYNLSKIQF